MSIGSGRNRISIRIYPLFQPVSESIDLISLIFLLALEKLLGWRKTEKRDDVSAKEISGRPTVEDRETQLASGRGFES